MSVCMAPYGRRSRQAEAYREAREQAGAYLLFAFQRKATTFVEFDLPYGARFTPDEHRALRALLREHRVRDRCEVTRVYGYVVHLDNAVLPFVLARIQQILTAAVDRANTKGGER